MGSKELKIMPLPRFNRKRNAGRYVGTMIGLVFAAFILFLMRTGQGYFFSSPFYLVVEFPTAILAVWGMGPCEGIQNFFCGSGISNAVFKFLIRSTLPTFLSWSLIGCVIGMIVDRIRRIYSSINKIQ